MDIDLKKLAEFLVRAKKATYAGDGEEVAPERPGFTELEYHEGDLFYRDSYDGFYQAPGQEVVRQNNKPIWTMAYSGGMTKKYLADSEMANNAFGILKKALMAINAANPYRGPENLKDGDWEYVMQVDGDITNFRGHEEVVYKGEMVFAQDFIGGLIINK